MIQNFSDLNDVDFLKKSPNEVNKFWYNLLKFLEQDDGRYNNSISNETGLFNFIEEKTDLSPDFFNEIYNDITSSLNDWLALPIPIDNIQLKVQDDYFWNESVAQLMQQFYLTLDPAGIEMSEDGWLIEKENGEIDKDWLKAGLKVQGRTNVRILDLKNADAGNSFSREKDIYKYFNYLTEFKVIITERVDGENKILERFPNPYSYAVIKNEIIENNPEQYFYFFNRDRNDVEGLSDGYKIVKYCLENWNDYGWLSSDFFNEINSLPDYIRSAATGEIPQEGTGYQYFKGRVEIKTIKLKIVENPCVIPWYNMDGNTYKLVRSLDLKKSIMSWGDNNQEELGKYFLDFTHKHNTDFSHYNWTRLLIPQSKRRVEIEDLNRNFWVIGQTIAGITAYLLGPNGPYGSMIGSALNELMQLWENVLLMWGEIAMQTTSHPDIAVEFVYVDASELVRSDSLYYDNIETTIENKEDYTENVIENEISYNGKRYLTNGQIHHLKKNLTLEQAIVQQLKKYHKNKYQEYNAILIPLLRLNNYESNYYSRLICPGYYKYQKNYKDFAHIQNPLKSIEYDGVHYADAFDMDGAENVSETDASLSKYKESFLAFTFKNENNIFYEFDFSILKENEIYTDFAPYISGIFEYENENGYGGVNYFEFADQLPTPNKETVYGLLMPKFRAAAVEMTNGITLDLQIEIYDLAKYYLTTDSLIKNNAEQYYNYRIYAMLYNISQLLISEYPSGINIIEDIRRYTQQDQNKFFKELIPNISEFGYYLGDAISNKKGTKKIIYNLKTYIGKNLRPSKFPDPGKYKSYYGQDLSELTEQERITIRNDMQNDEAALTNFLSNSYNWWKNEYSANIFWNREREKYWDYSSSTNNIIAYEQNPNSSEWFDKIEINKNRKEVQKSYQNTDLVWDSIEKWKETCQDEMMPLFGEGEMSSSTLLFVSGRRNLDYSPALGINEEGYNFIAEDGFIHHAYSCANAATSSEVGAALRVPIPGDEDEIVYYPVHTSPSGAKVGYSDNLVYEEKWTWRTNEIGHAPLCITNFDGSVAINQPDENQTYRTRPMYFQNGNDIYTLFNEGSFISSVNGSEEEQNLVLRKIGDDEITPKNWRICKLISSWLTPVRYVDFKKDDRDPNYIDDYRILKNEIKQLNSNIIGEELEIDSSLKKSYDGYLFRRYILYKLNQLGLRTKEDFIHNNISLNKLFPYKENEDKNGKYNLHLDTLLFGWLRVVINSKEYELKCNYNNPFDYYGYTENQIDVIRTVRKAQYSNDIDSDILWTFIDITPSRFWKNNEKPNKNDFNNNSENYYIGSFNGIYTGSRNLSGEEQTEQFWYEDRIIDREIEVLPILQQRLLIKDPQYSSEWIGALENIFYSHQETWHDDNNNIVSWKECAKYIEKYIYPLEGELKDTQKIKMTALNGSFIEIKDVMLFYARMNVLQRIYVFGPKENDESLYARRGIYRYSPSLDGLENVDIDSSKRGKWPERPSNLLDNAATNWKDDYSYTGYTVDELRDGYEIIYIIGQQDRNFELYKSHLTEGADKMRQNRIPQATAPNDDLDYANVYQNQKWGDEM